MAGGTDWSSVETYRRFLAAIHASGVKIDLKAAAKYYGCTYDTLENQFRKIKKDGAVLKEEVDSGQRAEIPTPSRTKSAPVTPRKQKTPKKDPLNAVANGRISKTTPSKKRTGIKQESCSADASSSLEDTPGTNGAGSVAHHGHLFDAVGDDLFAHGAMDFDV